MKSSENYVRLTYEWECEWRWICWRGVRSIDRVRILGRARARNLRARLLNEKPEWWWRWCLEIPFWSAASQLFRKKKEKLMLEPAFACWSSCGRFYLMCNNLFISECNVLWDYISTECANLVWNTIGGGTWSNLTVGEIYVWYVVMAGFSKILGSWKLPNKGTDFRIDLASWRVR